MALTSAAELIVFASTWLSYLDSKPEPVELPPQPPTHRPLPQTQPSCQPRVTFLQFNNRQREYSPHPTATPFHFSVAAVGNTIFMALTRMGTTSSKSNLVICGDDCPSGRIRVGSVLRASSHLQLPLDP